MIIDTSVILEFGSFEKRHVKTFSERNTVYMFYIFISN